MPNSTETNFVLDELDIAEEIIIKNLLNEEGDGEINMDSSEIENTKQAQLLEENKQDQPALAGANVSGFLVDDNKELVTPDSPHEFGTGYLGPEVQDNETEEYIEISLRQRNEKIYNKIEQVVNLMYFKSTKINDPNEYYSAKEKSPLIASLFEKPIRDFLMSSGLLEKWWNMGHLREKTRFATDDSIAQLNFFRSVKTNAMIVNALLNSEGQYKLLDANLCGYWDGLEKLAYAVQKEMGKKEHCYTKNSL